MPESVAVILPNQTPATEVTTDDGTWQVQSATGQVVFTPSHTRVGDPEPLTFTAERTDGTAVMGCPVVDYVATGAGTAQAPAAVADAATPTHALAWTGSDAGATFCRPTCRRPSQH